MAEYIDRENYCKSICRCSRDKCDKDKCPLWAAPAADVREVVRGKWVYDENATDWGIGGVCLQRVQKQKQQFTLQQSKAGAHVFGCKVLPKLWR